MTQGASDAVRWVDQSELRTNQALTVVLLVTAYLVDDWRLVAVQSGFFLLTTISLWLGPYILVYRAVLKPLGIIKPDLRLDNPEPHRFATTIGIIVSGLAGYLLFSGATVFGWALVWLVIVLGALAFFGWCAGCFTYYMIHRLGAAGFFRHAPAAGTIPGARPPRR